MLGAACKVTGKDPFTGETLSIVIENGSIVGLDRSDERSDLWLAPGFIDVQINGYAGHDFNTANLTPAVVKRAADAIFATGTTTFLPTVITQSEQAITRAVATIAEATRGDPQLAAAIPFIHVEGPFISPEDGPRGAHERQHVRAPDIVEFERWQAACDGLVGLVTLSPHWPGTVEFIAELRKRNVLVSIGHTHADPQQIKAAVDAGATLSTHLGNGALAVLPRHPNLIWAQLADDRLTASFIGDGQHLPCDTLQAMIRAKGLDRSILISDAIALAGLPPGIYDSPIGGKVELTAEGRTTLIGTPYLAGAACSLGKCIAVAADLSGFTLADAVRMATVNPGKIIGHGGILEIGAKADLVQFAWAEGSRSLDVKRVMLAGTDVLRS